jgi:hypothetical protein
MINYNMKRYIFSSLLLFVAAQIVNGQDRIITVERDTILCRIVSISNDWIRYEQQTEVESVGRFIPIAQVHEYQWHSRVFESNSRPLSKDISPLVFGLRFGGSLLVASSKASEKSMGDILGIPASQATDFHRKLKQGWTASADLHYLASDHFGIGVRYSLFFSQAEAPSLVINTGYPAVSGVDTYYTIGFKENMYVHHIGPSFIFPIWLDRGKNCMLTPSLSIGYTHYRSELRIDPNQYSFISDPTKVVYNGLIEASNWGLGLGTSFNYFPLSWLSIGASAYFVYCHFSRVTVSTAGHTETQNLDRKDYQNLSRLDAALNICFHFGN